MSQASMYHCIIIIVQYIVPFTKTRPQKKPILLLFTHQHPELQLHVPCMSWSEVPYGDSIAPGSCHCHSSNNSCHFLGIKGCALFKITVAPSLSNLLLNLTALTGPWCPSSSNANSVGRVDIWAELLLRVEVHELGAFPLCKPIKFYLRHWTRGRIRTVAAE